MQHCVYSNQKYPKITFFCIFLKGNSSQVKVRPHMRWLRGCGAVAVAAGGCRFIYGRWQAACGSRAAPRAAPPASEHQARPHMKRRRHHILCTIVHYCVMQCHFIDSFQHESHIKYYYLDSIFIIKANKLHQYRFFIYPRIKISFFINVFINFKLKFDLYLYHILEL